MPRLSLRRGALLLLLSVSVVAAFSCRRAPDALAPESAPDPCILVVIDGLRADYATPALMPHLNELGARGVVFENHHAAFPPVTAVNAASIITGAYPSTHGILGDRIRLAGLSSEPFDADSAEDLERLDAATGGRALTALTLAERIEGAGRDILAVASGSSGLAWILGYGAHPGPGRSAIVSPYLMLPASLQGSLESRIGGVPAEGPPDAQRSRWAVDVVIELGLGERRPALTILWFSDPDQTARSAGVGSAPTLEAVRVVDAELGRLVAALAERELLDRTNLIITTDHGSVRHSGGTDPAKKLLDDAAKPGGAPPDLVTSDNEIYLGEHSAARLRSIAEGLARDGEVGAVFTRHPRPQGAAGGVAGTLSYSAILREHERAGDIFAIPEWTAGLEGADFPGVARGAGPAGEGGGSPYEIQIPMVAFGPAFKRSVRSAAPSGAYDLAPTILRLQGLTAPWTMNGRVLREALRGGPEPPDLEVSRRLYRARVALPEGGQRVMEMQELGCEGVAYIQWIRKFSEPALIPAVSAAPAQAPGAKTPLEPPTAAGPALAPVP